MNSATVRNDHLVRQGLKLSHLRLLAALADIGQIGAAAQRVGITQPAASRLLIQLEQITGCALYTRQGRGVELTEAGRLLAEHALRTLQGLDQSWDMISQTRAGTRGLVRIGAVTGPALELVLPVIRDLRLSHPDIDIEVLIETSDKLAQALVVNTLDFYIGRIPNGVDSRPFRMDVIGTEPISLFVRQDHPLLQDGAVELQDCLACDWVMQPVGGLMRQATEHYLLARGHRLPARIICTTSTLFTLAIINETDAIAPLARTVGQFFMAQSASDRRLARLDVAFDLAVKSYGLVQRADSTPRPVVEHVLTALSQRRQAARKG